MDVKTVSVVAVVVGTAVYALYEYFFKNEAHRQQQYRHDNSDINQDHYDNYERPRTRLRRSLQSRSRESSARGNDRKSSKRKDDSCTICLRSLLKGVVIGTACDHQFHYKCLSQWLKERKVCPICRAHVSLD